MYCSVEGDCYEKMIRGEAGRFAAGPRGIDVELLLMIPRPGVFISSLQPSSSDFVRCSISSFPQG